MLSPLCRQRGQSAVPGSVPGRAVRHQRARAAGHAGGRTGGGGTAAALHGAREVAGGHLQGQTPAAAAAASRAVRRMTGNCQLWEWDSDLSVSSVQFMYIWAIPDKLAITTHRQQLKIRYNHAGR